MLVHRINRKGSILILALWTLLMLSLFAAAVGRAVQVHLNVIGRLASRQKLRDIAHAGIMKAIDVINAKEREVLYFDALNQDWSANEAEFSHVPVGEGNYSVRYERPGSAVAFGAEDEESKIHLNRVSSPITLTRIFQMGANIPEAEARGIALSILDWRDQDDNAFDEGAETKYYAALDPPYIARNGDIETLEELLWIKGITPVIYYRALPYLTLESSGNININTASPVVLYALGFSDSLIARILTYRAGSDARVGTEDDGVFQDVSKVVEILVQTAGLSKPDLQSLTSFMGSGQFQVFSEHFSIESLAHLQHRTEELTVRCIVERSGPILRWQETFRNAAS